MTPNDDNNMRPVAFILAFHTHQRQVPKRYEARVRSSIVNDSLE